MHVVHSSNNLDFVLSSHWYVSMSGVFRLAATQLWVENRLSLI